MDHSIHYTLYEIKDFGKLPPGTQIAVKRLFKDLHPSLTFFYPLLSDDGFYYHHGVYLGDCKVAHFSGANKSDAKPRECDILEFLDGAVDMKLYRVEYENPDMVRPVDETLYYARQMLEDPTGWPGYQLIKNNCETFATWLKTGKNISAQATQALIQVVSNLCEDPVGFSSGFSGCASGASTACKRHVSRHVESE